MVPRSSPAFASIERLYSRSSGPQHTSDLRTTFRDAACALSLGGRDQVIQHDAVDLVEQGLCQVDKVDGKTISGRLSEPVVVEAAVHYYAVHYYGLHSHVTANMSRAASGSQAGTTFERFMLPYIKRGFSEVVVPSRRPARLACSSGLLVWPDRPYLVAQLPGLSRERAAGAGRSRPSQ
jgi:hypothetical protein